MNADAPESQDAAPADPEGALETQTDTFSSLIEDLKAPALFQVDTGVRMREGSDSDTELLEMPRGSPAEICVRINAGDRVLGSRMCLHDDHDDCRSWSRIPFHA